MKHRYYTAQILFILCIVLSGCGLRKKMGQPILLADPIALTEKTPIPQAKKKTHQLIIFIHGATTFIPSLEAFRYAWQQTSKKRSNESFYQHYQNRIRFGGYRKKQAIGCKGLWLINLDEVTPTYVKRSIHTQEAFIIARLYKQVLKKASMNASSLYTFGWNGSMSMSCRKHSAHILYRAIHKKLAHIKKEFPNDTIEISLLGHSHGGNVALHLAQWEKQYQKNITIDRLILLGTPIQSETKPLIHAPIFKKIINLYSTNDWVQKLDCISTKDCFSGRTFHRRSKYQHTRPYNIPQKVTDLEVRIGSYRPMHAEFWFMGGIVHFFYRLKLPIYPFPLAIFVPCFEKALKLSGDHSNNLCLTLHRTSKNNYSFYLFDKKHRKWLNKHFTAHLPLTHLLPLSTQNNLEKRIKKGFCPF